MLDEVRREDPVERQRVVVEVVEGVTQRDLVTGLPSRLDHALFDVHSGAPAERVQELTAAARDVQNRLAAFEHRDVESASLAYEL